MGCFSFLPKTYSEAFLTQLNPCFTSSLISAIMMKACSLHFSAFHKPLAGCTSQPQFLPAGCSREVGKAAAEMLLRHIQGEGKA
tara:strand:- start:165 stop:416 length:252 start_codon:yes stop_codon:yes gene_type:complete